MVEKSKDFASSLNSATKKYMTDNVQRLLKEIADISDYSRKENISMTHLSDLYK